MISLASILQSPDFDSNRQLKGALYVIRAPAGSGAAEQFFMALHGLLRPPLRRLREGQPWIALELAGSEGQVRFLAWIPRGQEDFVEDILRAAYPGSEIAPADEDLLNFDEGMAFAASSVGLIRSDSLPINTDSDGEMLASLFSTLARARRGERIHLSLLVQPRPNGWQVASRTRAQRLRHGRSSLLHYAISGKQQEPFASRHEIDQAKLIEEKADRLGFNCALRVVAVAPDEVRARESLRSVAASLRPFAGANSFDLKRTRRPDRLLKITQTRALPQGSTFILNSGELASLWHMPKEPIAHVETVRCPMIAPPPQIPREGRVLGLATDRGEDRMVSLPIDQAMTHLSLIGSTGVGKTSLSVGLAAQDIQAGRSVIAISGKRDLIDGIIERIPRSRAGDVAVISVDGSGYSVGLNPLEWREGDDTELLADNLVTIFKREFGDQIGPRSLQLLNACVKTLLARPTSSLDEIPLLLFNGPFRSRVLSAFKEVPPVLANYWRWFDNLSEGQRMEVTSPLLNKADAWLMRDRMRRIICQPHSTIDLEQVMEGGKILLADLSTGVMGDETSRLIGSFLIGKIWQVRRRVAARQTPRDCALYIDEAQQFVTISDDIADLLAQARSYRLALTISNQSVTQLTRKFRDALASNARSRVVFQCGQADAAYLSREMAPLDAEALMALPKFHVAARLTAAGSTSSAFTFRTLPPPEVSDAVGIEEVLASSRSLYARPDEEIDAEARQRLNPKLEQPEFGVGRRLRES